MSQQTQIKTMLPYFERWMQRFPNFEALANADSEAVLREWEGLGYYSRARNLHKLAQAYCELTVKPTNRGEWQALPGIGPYTSAAISSIAFGEPDAVVDGNVVRVLARVCADTTKFATNAIAVKHFDPIAHFFLNTQDPGDHNQAIMELGATLCLKQKPLCILCPVRELCRGHEKGIADTLPKVVRKRAISLEVLRAWCVSEDKVLLAQNSQESALLAGQYELPLVESITGVASDGESVSYPLIMTRKRAITNRRFTERIYDVPSTKALEGGDADRFTTQVGFELQWIPIEDIETITISGPHRRWIRELLVSRFQTETPDSNDAQK